MVFLSYNWSQSEYTDDLESFLTNYHFQTLRDKHDIKISDSISDFMKQVTTSDYVLLLISNAYLKSYNCMNEAFIAYQNRNLNNIIPVIFPDANIFSGIGQIPYIKYWHAQLQEYQKMVQDLPPHKTIEINRKIRQIESYSSFIGDLLAYLADANAVCPVDGNPCFEQILHTLYDKIMSRELRPNVVAPATFTPAYFTRSGLNTILLSIDFGTSYTLASVLDTNGNSHLVPNASGQYIRPSTIEFTNSGQYLIGSGNQNAIRNIKRLISTQDTATINAQQVSLTLLTALVIKSVIRDAEQYLQKEIHNILMALPVDFCIREKMILKKSAEMAGVSVLRFIPESSAESLLSPSVFNNSSEFAAFIDFGGGTLDISLVEYNQNISEVLYSYGNHNLGSIDLDTIMETLLKEKISKQYGITATCVTLLAEQAKKEIGNQDSITVQYTHLSDEGNVVFLPVTITLQDFTSAATTILEQFRLAISNLGKVLNDYYMCSDLDQPSLSCIYLTGQGTKFPPLRQIIAQTYPNIPIIEAYQENAVIQGLSKQVLVLSPPNNSAYSTPLLLNAFPSSLHIVCGNTKILLDPNTTIPYHHIHDLEISANTTIEVYESTPSNRNHTLFRTQITFQPDNKYYLILDIDANLNGLIRLIETRSDIPFIPFIPFKDYNTFPIKFDRYTILYQYSF